MPIYRKPDFKILSQEELANLTTYKRQRYNIELAAYRRRKEKNDHFSEYLEESCDRYK